MITQPIRFPTATTPEAARAAFRSEARYLRAHTGWGGGKTYLGVHWMIKMAALNPGLRGVAIEPTHGMVTDVLKPAIEEVCARHKFPFAFERPHGRLDLLFPSLRFRWMLRSGDNPDTLVGPTLAAAWIDEAGLQQSEVFQKVDSRLRDARANFIQLLCTGTPDALNWFHSTWNNKIGNPEYASYHWRTRDNARNLASGYVDNLRGSLSELQFRAFEGGEFLALTAGVVFPEFSDADGGNVIAPFRPRPGKSKIIWLMDFNVDPMTPSGWTLRGAGDQMEARCFTEICIRHSHAEEMALEIKKRYPFREFPGQRIICDATGSSGSSVTGRSHTDILQQHGFTVDYKHVQIEADPINAARRMIKAADGKRRMFISSACPKLITSMKTWSYKPHSNKTQEEEYANDNDLYFVPHFADHVKYLAWNLFPIRKLEWRIS